MEKSWFVVVEVYDVSLLEDSEYVECILVRKYF